MRNSKRDMRENMNTVGLILNFIAAIMLLVYSERTEGSTNRADRDYLASPWWYRLGFSLLAIGFLLQVMAVSWK